MKWIDSDYRLWNEIKILNEIKKISVWVSNQNNWNDSERKRIEVSVDQNDTRKGALKEQHVKL